MQTVSMGKEHVTGWVLDDDMILHEINEIGNNNTEEEKSWREREKKKNEKRRREKE